MLEMLKKKKIEKDGKEEEITEMQKHIMRYQQLFATYAISPEDASWLRKLTAK